MHESGGTLGGFQLFCWLVGALQVVGGPANLNNGASSSLNQIISRARDSTTTIVFFSRQRSCKTHSNSRSGEAGARTGHKTIRFEWGPRSEFTTGWTGASLTLLLPAQWTLLLLCLLVFSSFVPKSALDTDARSSHASCHSQCLRSARLDLISNSGRARGCSRFCWRGAASLASARRQRVISFVCQRALVCACVCVSELAVAKTSGHLLV